MKALRRFWYLPPAAALVGWVAGFVWQLRPWHLR